MDTTLLGLSERKRLLLMCMSFQVLERHTKTRPRLGLRIRFQRPAVFIILKSELLAKDAMGKE